MMNGETDIWKTLADRVEQTMLSDRHRLRRALVDVQRRSRNVKHPQNSEVVKPEEVTLLSENPAFLKLKADFEKSATRAEERRRRVPQIDYDDQLPIVSRKTEIGEALRDHQVIVVCGETGSGKSTQLPKLCLELGRGVTGMIGHTQPRRIAARSVSARVAEELKTKVGDLVGFKVRFTDATSQHTLIKLMTDGILLAETQSDRFLSQYDTIIIDEAHERSLNIDLLLGYIQRLLPKRPELRLIITSATIETARFAEFFASPGPQSQNPGSLSPHPSPQFLPPVFEVSGRMYPVELRWRPLVGDGESEDADILQAVAAVVEEAAEFDTGDMLIFLPTERDIRDCAEMLRGRSLRLDGPGKKTEILPLYGRLSEQAQNKVFQPHSHRRIVIATNVAESSLTVPGIKYVIDTGTARISRFVPQSKVQRLPIEAISQASAEQRKGRCGRVAPGVCYRLYDEKDYLSRERFTPPEIQRTNLASVILQLKSLGLGDIASFPFLDPPNPAAIRSGYTTLFELGALSPEQGGDRELETGDRGQGTGGLGDPGEESKSLAQLLANLETRVSWEPTLTKNEPVATPSELDGQLATLHSASLSPIGRTLAKMPVDPRIGRMILAGEAEGCLAEILIIASVLEIRDPRERPIDKQQAADQAHQQFRDETSDFLTYLKLWNWFQELVTKLSNSQLKKACKQNFLSESRMREWRDMHRLLGESVRNFGNRELRTGDGKSGDREPGTGDRGGVKRPYDGRPRPSTADQTALVTDKDVHRTVPGPRSPVPSSPTSVAPAQKAAAIHRAILGGLLSNVATRGETNEYTGSGGQKLFLWPGSALNEKKPKWIVAAELVETTRRYARTVAAIDPQWIEPLAPHLVSKSYSEPHWHRDSAAVMAFEKVSLFGLTIIPQRRCRYGNIDPVKAREMFIEHALVQGDYDSPGAWRKANNQLKEELQKWQAKLRQTQILRQEDAEFEFFDKRLPRDVFDGPRFEKWRKQAEQTQPQLLFLTKEDLLEDPTRNLDHQSFPDELALGKLKLPLEYRLEPGADQDGLTLVVPQEALHQLSAARLGWLVPGLLEEKVVALLKSLPKSLRRLFVPIPETAREVVAQLKFGAGDLIPQVATILRKISNEHIPVEAFEQAELPQHLRLNFRLTDGQGKELAAGRDLEKLRQQVGGEAAAALANLADDRWQKHGLQRWNFGELPAQITLNRQALHVTAFPTLIDQGADVSLQLTDNLAEAERQTRRALVRLFLITEEKRLKDQAKFFPKRDQLGLWWKGLQSSRDQSPPSASTNLESQLTFRIAERALFYEEQTPLPRTESQWRDLSKLGVNRIGVAIQDLAELLEPLLSAAFDLSRLLAKKQPQTFQPVVTDLQQQLELLLAPEFLVTTPWSWLQQYPRYLQAMRHRWDKLANGGLPRDQQQFALVQMHWQRFRQLVVGPPAPPVSKPVVSKTAPISSPVTRVATVLVRAPSLTSARQQELSTSLYRWLLEEYRVSLFAQHLRTAVPVSPKRLQEAWETVT